MSLSIKVLHYEYNNEIGDEVCTKTDEIHVEDLDKNLMSCIKEVADRDLILLFYYPDTDKYDSLLNEGKFPFILKEGQYNWHVSPDEVTVRDFISTFEIDEEATIILKETGFGKGDRVTYVSAIVEWIPFIIIAFNDLGMVLTASKVFQTIMPYYHKLIGKDNKVVSPYDFLKMLNSRDSWTMKELQSRTTLDEKMIECMLIQGGFKKLDKEHIYRRFETDGVECINYDDTTEIEELLWGEYSNAVDDDTYEYDYITVADEFEEDEEYAEDDEQENDYSELMYAIHDINRCLTSLKMQSDYHKSDSFDFMMKIIDYHISRWSRYLYKGKKLCFIKPKAGLYDISDYELSRLLYSTECLCEYVSRLCEIIDADKEDEQQHESNN